MGINLSNKKAVLIIFILGLIAYLTGLNYQEFTKIGIRYALFTAEIKQYGIGLFPTLYGKPYTDYPSLGIILMYFVSLGGNYINMFTAAFPGAIMSAFTLTLTYLIGAKISKNVGWYSVFISFLSIEYLSQIRGPSLDVYVVFVSTLSFYLIYTADLEKKWKRLLIIPLCFIFGFAFRGPLGFMIPSAVVCGYYLVNRKLKLFIIFAMLSAILAIICMTTLISLSNAYGGKELVQCFLNDQIFNRAKSNDYLLYYFIDGMGTYAIIYPLGFLIFILYFKKLLRPLKEDSPNIYFLRSVSSWMMIILILMTIPGAKNPRYIISMIPAACLLSSFIFVNYDKIMILDKLKWLLLLICKIAPFACLVAFITAIAIFKIIKVDILFNIPITLIAFVILSISVIIIQKQQGQANHCFALLAVMACVMAVLHIMIIEPIGQKVEGARNFAAKIESIRERNNTQIWFLNFGPDGDELKFFVNIPQEKRFIPHFINPSLLQEIPSNNNSKQNYIEPDSLKKNITKLLFSVLPDTNNKYPKIEPRYFIHSINKINSLPQQTIYICRTRDFEKKIPKELQSKFEILLSEKMGHQKCIAFRKKE